MTIRWHIQRQVLYTTCTLNNILDIVMNKTDHLQNFPKYNPNKFLDTMREKLFLKNDAALSRTLEVGPPVISKIRHGRLPIGGALLIRIHEVTGLSIADLRSSLGDRRTKFRISDAQGRPAVAKLLTAT